MTASCLTGTDRLEPAIAIDGLGKRYGSVTALDDVTLTVRPGEVLGVLGPSGAGKSTLLEILAGLRPASAGRVRVLGFDPGRERTRLAARIGVQTHHTSLFERLTVAETLRLFAALRPRPVPVPELLEAIGLEDDARVRVSRLTGGRRRRLALGVALVGRPDLLFLDEPTEALDPPARRRLWTTISAECGRGATVVLTTRCMEEAQAVCDRVAIVDRGRLVALGTPAALVARHAPEDLERPTLEDVFLALTGRSLEAAAAA